MKFERETNLYQDQALVKKFQSQDTDFEVLRGKISYLISDSEIAEWQDGDKTLTSRMNAAEATSEQFSRQISEVRTEYSDLSGDISDVSESLNDYIQTADRTISTITQTIQHKSKVFNVAPTVPYSVGDLWIKGQEIYVCTVSKGDTDTENLSDDWAKATNYLKTSDWTNWVENTYGGDKDVLQAQIDGKIQTWSQPSGNDPQANWSEDTKQYHDGDLWYQTDTGITKRYSWNTTQASGSWVEQSVPNSVLANIAAKATIYTSETRPTPPYALKDLWVQGASGDIKVCVCGRTSGSGAESDWEKASKYTDDSAWETWVDDVYGENLQDIQSQIDGKAETWYQSNDPSSAWTTADLKSEHTKDIWYCTATTGNYAQKCWRWNGTSWDEITANPPSDVFNTLNGKRQIFVAQPTNDDYYEVGDIWVNATYPATSPYTYQNDLLRCKTAKSKGSAFNISHWEKASKYTDDSVFNAWNNSTYQTFQSFIDQLPNKIRLEVTGSETIDPKTMYSGAYTGSDIPTNENSPAINWETDSVRENHVNDIYCRSTGEVYQYVSGKDGLIIKFSEKCNFISTNDFVQIYYPKNNGYRKARYGGTSLSGAQVFVPSLTFWLYFHTSYYSENDLYGFSIDEISHGFSDIEPPSSLESSLPNCAETPVSGETYPESNHNPYNKGVDILWKYTASGTLGTENYGWVRRTDPEIRQAKASIEILDDQIQSKVDVNGVISSINQSAEEITINANRVALNGDTIIDAINGAEGTVVINANKTNLTGDVIIDTINNGTGNFSIDANKINLNGVVTANNNFKIDTDGSMQATAGTIANFNIGKFALAGLNVASGYRGLNILRGATNPKVSLSQGDNITWRYNYFRKTPIGATGSAWVYTNYSPLPSGVSGYSTNNVIVLSSNGAVGADIGFCQDQARLQGYPVTFSVWVRGAKGARVDLQPFWVSTDSYRKAFYLEKDYEWEKISVTATPSKDYQSISIGYVYFVPRNANEVLYVFAPKLEYGVTATAYNDGWSWEDPEEDKPVASGVAIGRDGIRASSYYNPYYQKNSVEIKDGMVRFIHAGTSIIYQDSTHGECLDGYFSPECHDNESGIGDTMSGVSFFTCRTYDLDNLGTRLMNLDTGIVTINGKIEYTSDRRLKKDIVDLDDKYVRLIDKLQPKEYRLKVKDDKPVLGFIAQDVLEATDEVDIEEQPFVGGTGKGERYYTIDYIQFIPILVRKCQMQDEEIQNLKDEIAELKNLIKGLAHD